MDEIEIYFCMCLNTMKLAKSTKKVYHISSASKVHQNHMDQR